MSSSELVEGQCTGVNASMGTQGIYGAAISSRVHLEDEAPAFVSKTLKNVEVAITHLRIPRPNLGLTDPFPIEDAYLVGYWTQSCIDSSYWVDGKAVGTVSPLKGQTWFYDLRTNPISHVRSMGECLMYYLPRSAFNAIADEGDAPRVRDLQHSPGIGVDDPVIRGLSAAMLPAFENQGTVSRMFLDHVTLAVAVHLAQTYSGRAPRQLKKGGLSHRSLRRAKEIIDAHLDGNVSLTRLALECGMSTSHFARAFRQSVGVTPHRWLLLRRIEVAKELLCNSTQSICEIGLDCGFADQSHLTRVFRDFVGVGPGEWRRENRKTKLDAS
jgi:AraC family transcriptional regulator